VDAPPHSSKLRVIPELTQKLADVLPRVGELHDYQYRLLKYYIEHYRIEKYAPNAGYFQFMWIDLSPQSFYGIFDYWGAPKTEGLGGGLRAIRESNQPVGIFMEHDTQPVALHAVNDTTSDLGSCLVRWKVVTASGVIEEGSERVQIGPDSHLRVRDFTFPVGAEEKYDIELSVVASDGTVLATNNYVDPFKRHLPPSGYPQRRDDELGMRLWWAGKNE
jgi:beta-mannosidase